MKEKIKWLESIRGLACLVVLIAHIVASNPTFGIYASGCGKIGVWVFMLLSGMLLILPYVDNEQTFSIKQLPGYYKKKFFRMYPYYFLSICAAICMGFIPFHNLIKHAFLIEAWGHFWYMPVIIKFYIIAPIFLITFSALKQKTTKYSIALFASIIFILAVSFCTIFPYTNYIENSTRLYWYLPVFILGMLLAIAIKKITICNLFMDILSFISLCFIVIATPLFRELFWNTTPSGYLQNKYLYIGICEAILIFSISKSKYIKDIFGKTTLLQKTGSISYEIYLIHFLFLQKLVQIQLPTIIVGVLTILLSFGTAIIIKLCTSHIYAYIYEYNSQIRKTAIPFVLAGLVLIFTTSYNGISQVLLDDTVTDTSYLNQLYVPTMINKINDTYFIMDCWNHRVLYSDTMDADISNWDKLTNDDYIGGHTICSDGELIVLDNTDNNSILVYRETSLLKKNNKNMYILTQTINNITGRPHYITYDSVNNYFYVISSIEGTIHVLKNNKGYLELVRSEVLDEITGSYVRSISIIDNCLYTVSGPGYIYKYSISKDAFSLVESYVVPSELSGMNQITKIEDYFYLTINTGATGSVEETTIVRVRDLNALAASDYENLYDTFGFVGQPYFITQFDNSYYITEISENHGNGIKKFQIDSNNITNISTVYYWDNVSESAKANHQYRESLAESKEKVDLFLFAGQSNMSGKGTADKAPAVIKGYEFRSVSNPSVLYPITEPFGVMENRENGINDTWENMTVLRKTGSLVSAFANSYYRLTGTPIVGVSCSEGATTISQWLPGTDRYNDLIERATSAKTYLEQSEQYLIQHTYLVWCQGESDGDIRTTQYDYYQSLKNLTDSLIQQNIVDHCFIIAIGENADNPELYTPIRNAQLNLCTNSNNCTLISNSFLGMKDKELMIDEYHYSQEGYNIVGAEAGRNAAYYSIMDRLSP